MQIVLIRVYGGKTEKIDDLFFLTEFKLEIELKDGRKKETFIYVLVQFSNQNKKDKIAFFCQKESAERAVQKMPRHLSGLSQILVSIGNLFEKDPI